ncbi:Cytoplasmic dynein 2 heavy chain 1 [Borealophlyctis nickersoniae]|nr:Cytoplasmic dynein 2 heavy chain 1 [Borealophlyctis nickersoniae]
MLGLPANIDRTVQVNASAGVVAQLKVMRQVDVTEDRFDKDRWARELTPFLQLWKKVNTGNDLIQRKIPAQTADEEPIITFLTLELTNALTLLRTIHTTLSHISKILRGTLLVSPDIATVASSLMRGDVPPSWSTGWEDGPTDPTSFLKLTVAKTMAVDVWRTKCVEGVLFKQPVRVENVFHPATFLSAVRQATSRKLRIPMDNLKLVSTWSPAELTSAAAIVVAVEGLYLQGCTFDGVRLSESGADDPSCGTVPVCYVAWMPKTFTLPNRIGLPLYQTPSREKVIAGLQVPCVDDGAVWVLAGAAFFLSPS